MAGDQSPLTGPDLAIGLESSRLADGIPVLGHAHGEAVLLLRAGTDVLAIGATCTHYGGPLAEGLIVGETVRCPWHHACFSLRTGEALRPPALNPVACWKTEQRDGRVFVTEKSERAPLAPIAAMPSRLDSSVRHVGIVGMGAAGSAAVEALRREGYEGEITVFDPEADAPYDRPNCSKDYLAGSAPEEWIPLRPPGFYEAHGVKRIAARVISLEASRRRLTTGDHRDHDFDAILLATGASPIRLDIQGSELPHVHTLRSLADSRAIISAITGAKRAVVIGASFIGLETAASLRARGLEVHVVGPESRPLERILGAELGDHVRALHESHGVIFHLGTRPRAIESSQVILDNDTRLAADIVVMGVGVRPELTIAEHAGLMLDRGVLVNEHLETSATGIFAAGDIARWPDPHSRERIRVEHWVVAQRQGQAAARNMLGLSERFDAVPFFWSAHYDVTIAYVGHAERWDRIDLHGDLANNDCVAAYLSGDRALAVATIFRDEDSLVAERALEHNDWQAVAGILAGHS